jgi:hypothetical protein
MKKCKHDFRTLEGQEKEIIQSGACINCGMASARIRPDVKIVMPDWMEKAIKDGKSPRWIMEEMDRRGSQ